MHITDNLRIDNVNNPDYQNMKIGSLSYNLTPELLDTNQFLHPTIEMSIKMDKDRMPRFVKHL